MHEFVIEQYLLSRQLASCSAFVRVMQRRSFQPQPQGITALHQALLETGSAVSEAIRWNLNRPGQLRRPQALKIRAGL